MFANWLPLIGLMLFLLVGVLWRSWLQYRRYGHIGIVLFRSAGWRRQMRDAVFCLLAFALLAQTLASALSPASLSDMMITSQSENLLSAGAVLMLTGLALT